LCRNNLETPAHLWKDCLFVKEVWELVKQWTVTTDISSSAQLAHPGHCINSGGDAEQRWIKVGEEISKEL